AMRTTRTEHTRWTSLHARPGSGESWRDDPGHVTSRGRSAARRSAGGEGIRSGGDAAGRELGGAAVALCEHQQPLLGHGDRVLDMGGAAAAGGAHGPVVVL